MINKRGISTIIITIIMIALVLGAFGVVWAIANQALEDSADDVELSAKCLDINLVATSLNCASGSCDVKVNRRAGGSDFAGLKLILSNTDETGDVETSSGNIGELETKTIQNLDMSSFTENPDTVEISVYFQDESGNDQICPQSKTFDF